MLWRADSNSFHLCCVRVMYIASIPWSLQLDGVNLWKDCHSVCVYMCARARTCSCVYACFSINKRCKQSKQNEKKKKQQQQKRMFISVVAYKYTLPGAQTSSKIAAHCVCYFLRTSVVCSSSRCLFIEFRKRKSNDVEDILIITSFIQYQVHNYNHGKRDKCTVRMVNTAKITPICCNVRSTKTEQRRAMHMYR